MTRWSLVLQACRGEGDSVRARQAELLERYAAPIYRYARKVLGDDDLAQEACQEFALRFVRGDFRHADPSRGRFRDYVKTAVVRLLDEFRRNRRARPVGLPINAVGEPSDDARVLDDAEFQRLWRSELLNRAWRELADRQVPGGPPYYQALRLKADDPSATADQIADRLKAQGEADYTPAGVRQLLHRAREQFAGLLLDEVRRSLTAHDADALSEELAELDLLRFCRTALNRRRGGSA